MKELRCVDGSLLGVAAVPCHDKAGQPYEVTLRLVRDRQPFAVVGERCGYQLAALAAQVQAARDDPEQARYWPDPDDRFPESHGIRAPGAARSRATGPAQSRTAFLPGEREYFTLKSRDRGDLPGLGEVRCVLRSTAQWHASTAEAGPGGGPGGPRILAAEPPRGA